MPDANTADYHHLAPIADYANDVMLFCSCMPFDEFYKMTQPRIENEMNSGAGITQLTLAMVNARYPFMKIDDSWRYGNDKHKRPDDDYVTDIRSHIMALDDGWLRSFGIYICEDIRDVLVEYGLIGDDGKFIAGVDYIIEQIKEKFGTLRWYASLIAYDDDIIGDATADEVNDRLDLIVAAYELISSVTCISCGTHDGVRFNRGWISPTCYKCYAINELTMYDNQIYEGEFIKDTDEGPLDRYRTDGALCTVYTQEGQYRYDILDCILGNGAPHMHAADIIGDILGDDIRQRYAQHEHGRVLPSDTPDTDD